MRIRSLSGIQQQAWYLRRGIESGAANSTQAESAGAADGIWRRSAALAGLPRGGYGGPGKHALAMLTSSGPRIKLYAQNLLMWGCPVVLVL
jgi:hypothetical protein